MSTNGILDFQNTNKIIFGGSDSNVVIDTSNVSLGIGIQGTETPGSNLHVVGNAFISSNLKLTTDTSILVNSNVVTDFSGPHGRVAPTLKKYPEIAFADGKFDSNESTNTYVQAGYIAESSSARATNEVWKAFNGIQPSSHNDNENWRSMDNTYSSTDSGGSTYPATRTIFESTPGEWIGIRMPKKIKISKATVSSRWDNTDPRPVKEFKIWGSFDASQWYELASGISTLSANQSPNIFTINVTTTEYYSMFRLQILSMHENHGEVCVGELQLYGYEEDPPLGDTSVDTTFMSIMNTPQTTGANVYVDAKLSSAFTNRVTGPTPVGTATTHDNTNKYWEMNGELTSNITVEANTFLEGDQPHAVSVWFNSSNLEANVSNTCVFSVSDQEHLNSQNLDLQSNTWHNLTYAYQGEGGSRVTYLDGRKVSEDQAEDTFGLYPPFDMSGYAQGGYVASASSENTGQGTAPGRVSYKAFNSLTDANLGLFQPLGGKYNTNGTTTSSAALFEGERGEWVKLELPIKIKLGYVSVKSTSTAERVNTAKIFGSNDDINWEVIKDTHTLTYSGDVSSYSVNSTKYFKYLLFQILSGFTGGTQPQLYKLQYYGHRENDLVRLPDPTNVLKYPHVTMTGPAQRGYVVSASSDQSQYNLDTWKAFDGVNASGSGWASQVGTYYDGSSPGPNSYTGTAHQLGTGTVYGEYLQLELPHKIKVTKFILYADPGVSWGVNEAPKSYKVYGSVTGSSWTELKDVSNETPSTSGNSHDVTDTTAYKYLGIVVTQVNTNQQNIRIGELEFYGTGVDSIPLQIGGGNIDKVANFRVYDKFVGEDQALEIWDAQKDEFGRAKSSMTLQKGRLGIGTTEPQGRLVVADEPHAPEEFPPRAGGFDGDEWYIEGHGTFKACASNYHTSKDYYPGRAFTKSLVVNFGYASLSDATVARWSGNNGLPNQSSSDPVGTFQGHQGDWLELELPYRIRVKSFQIQTRIDSNSPDDHPKNGFLYGSNNRQNWTQITEFTNLTYTPSELDGIGAQKAIWNINSETGFKYLRLLTTQKINGSSAWLMISELKYFGTREQGQSVLHDGQLTLTKNLTVPRIGPALDADDTPRRDRLVVEYNTSTNPTFEGAVRDTSGRGNDGILMDGAYYDATVKAFEFDGTNNHIFTGNIGNPAGAYVHSASFWVNPDVLGGVFMQLGKGPDVASKRFQVVIDSASNQISFGINSANTKFASTGISAGSWFHVAYSYDGGLSGPSSTAYKLYVNGVSIAGPTSGTNTAALNLDANAILAIGADHFGAGTLFNGQISNFKLYDTALTTEEVKTLYDMGRCDEGHHVVNFSKTRVGIGLGDGEAPRGALDVRDEAVFSSIRCLANRLDLESQGLDDLLVIEGKKTTTDNKIHEGVRFKHTSSHQTGYRGITWHNTNNNFLMGGVTMAVGGSYNNCNINFHAAASRVNGETRRAYINSGNNGNRITTFTGQHRCVLHDISLNNIESYEGIIVSANKNQYMNVNGDISRGSNAITINESIPIVALSDIEKDKKCFGVISTSEDTETREEQHGNLTSLIEKEKGDTRVFINSVGEGAIWVVNTNGSLESGDYITTSNVAGYGQKQTDDVLHNYTVAKITMDCDFEPVTQPIQIIKKDENGENVLDEHSQIQWEDHATETEKAYKVRFLTTDGTQTDEANAVHIAAFVGCTYHCG